ncbi:MAG: hypothetical protein L6W00_30595 [Lentisphaeria bacterium]|nr:MAG: hypothetical protein L6W00_30595 [Lentisphaeria bacterium]
MNQPTVLPKFFAFVINHILNINLLEDYFTRKASLQFGTNQYDNPSSSQCSLTPFFTQGQTVRQSLMQKPDARRKNLLRKGSFLLALFLFQTFLEPP